MFILSTLLKAFDDNTEVKIYTTRLKTMVSPLIPTEYYEITNLTCKETGTAKELLNKYEYMQIYVLNCYVRDNSLIMLVDEFSLF